MTTQTCPCGKHNGIGAWSPEYRAKVYYWHRKMKTLDTHQADYLHSWEKAHGRVTQTNMEAPADSLPQKPIRNWTGD